MPSPFEVFGLIARVASAVVTVARGVVDLARWITRRRRKGGGSDT